jgi:hypothetical protein
MMRRRTFIAGLAAASLADVTIPATRAAAEDLHFEIEQLLIAIRSKLAEGDRSTAKQLASQLTIFSQRDPNWAKYPESFQIAVVLASLTDPSNREQWISANRGVLETYGGASYGDGRQNNQAAAQAAYAVLAADNPPGRYITPEYRGRAASLLLVLAGVAPGPERVLWAKTGRRESQLFGTEALSRWAVDRTTPRMEAAGVAVAGDWAAAAAQYQMLLKNSIGAMTNLIQKREGETLSGLVEAAAGQATLEAEGATVFAMSGQLDLAVMTLENSRRNTLGTRYSAASNGKTALEFEATLVQGGAVVVQPVVSYVGSFALITVQRHGATERFVSYDPEWGGLELFYRLMSSNLYTTNRNGLLPAYLSARRSLDVGSTDGELIRYADRARSDADQLIGHTIRDALAKAGVAPGEDIVVVIPANLALLPVEVPRAPIKNDKTPYRLRFAGSLSAAVRCRNQAAAFDPAQAGLVAVAGQNSGLPNTQFEIDCISAQFGTAQRSPSPEKSGRRQIEAMDGRAYWHFACHGAWNFDRPKKSGLALGADRVITVDDIVAAELKNPPRLVFLSACETALFDIEVSLDQFNGLCTAFLNAGAACVIGSLWPVSDAATALLAAKFYDEHLGATASPSEAMQRAQSWLCDSSAAVLSEYVRGKIISGKTTADAAAALSDFLSTAPPAKRIFAEPYYWAGFQVYGA